MNLSISFARYGGLSAQEILPYSQAINLEHLTLKNGIIKQNLSLAYQPSLVSLNLAYCNIEHIPDGTFNAIPNLKHLNLANNLLDGIPTGISSLVYLETLNMSHNPLRVSAGDTSPLHQLYHLQVFKFSHVALNDLSVLRSLFSASDIKLIELHLNGCNISMINDTTILDKQSSLEILDMSDNKLKYIPVNFFKSLTNLKFLNLSLNYFYEAPQLILNKSAVLFLLDLSFNYITSPINIVAHGQVEFINLSRNNISSWYNFTALSENTKITCLNISYNFIEHVNNDMIEFLKTLQCVDLGMNPLNCKVCDILLLKDWYEKETRVRILNLNSSESLSCGLNGCIMDVAVNPDLCEEEAVAAVLVPIAILFSMILLAVVLVCGYKFEVTHLIHLMDVKCDWFMKRARKLKYDAFVCYSSADRAFVLRELVYHLETGPEKYKLCLQDRDFVLGRYITQNIINCLQDSKYTIVIITSKFINSKWCKWELEMAKHKLFEDGEDFLIFLDLEHLNRQMLPRHLRHLMSTQAYIKWPSKASEEITTWTRLKMKLGDSLYMKKHGIKFA